MFPIILSSVPWRLFGLITLLLAAFMAGCQMGETKIQSAWDAQSIAQQQAVVQQAVTVAKHAETVQTINTEVSHEILQRRSHLATVHFRGLRDTDRGHGAVSSVSIGASSAQTAREGCVSAADYEQLARDAADDAIIIEAWQHWYEKQQAAWPATEVVDPHLDQ